VECGGCALGKCGEGGGGDKGRCVRVMIWDALVRLPERSGSGEAKGDRGGDSC